MLPSESPFTPEDAAWLLMHQHRKVLDARVRITGVAARDAADGHPTVLVCYPLRDVGAESAAARSFEGRRETRGGSLRKWLSASPVPWPNFYWLCCPALAARVGRLEHLGLVQEWQNEIAGDSTTPFALELAAAHRQYGAARWAALSDDDRAYCESQHEGFVAALRDAGVGGQKFVSQVKCLHAHLAHALAGGDNPVGRRVLACLARRDDEAVCGGDNTGTHEEEAGSEEEARLQADLVEDTGTVDECHREVARRVTAVEEDRGMPPSTTRRSGQTTCQTSRGGRGRAGGTWSLVARSASAIIALALVTLAATLALQRRSRR